MALAGYSGTPLPRKLGIVPGARVRLVGAPDGIAELLVPWPEGARLLRGGDDLDVAHLFLTRRAELVPRHTALAGHVNQAGSIWVAWPKRGAGVATDLTGDIVRELILPSGWVDTKVCAIDATWSGLRFVRRREIRG
ncbi:MAG: DUF3052 domain-containing protein [Candidatus Dormiibacterota bacterium]